MAAALRSVVMLSAGLRRRCQQGTLLLLLRLGLETATQPSQPLLPWKTPQLPPSLLLPLPKLLLLLLMPLLLKQPPSLLPPPPLLLQRLLLPPLLLQRQLLLLLLLPDLLLY